MFRLGKPPKSKKRPSDDGLVIEMDSRSQRSWRLFGEFDARAEKIQQMVPYVAAQETFYGLMSRIPADRRWKTYRELLRVVRVGPKGWKGGVYAVYGKPKVAGGSATIEAARTVLYVHIKKNRLTPPTVVTRILAKYSPWTMETLPVVPKRSEAVVVTRQVSKKEVEKVEALRHDDEHEWKDQLRRAGVRTQRHEPTELKAKHVQDVAFEALRLEFGYGGLKAVPHWRPSIRAAAQVVVQLWRTRSKLMKPMLSPNERSWKHWPPQNVGSVRIAELKNMAKFQKRLRVRV